jgi:hypothetical protein
MSTVPTSGTKSAALNEKEEANKLGFGWMMRTPTLRGIQSKLERLKDAYGAGSVAAFEYARFMDFVKSLPPQKVLDKADALPEGKRGEWYTRLIRAFDGTNGTEDDWGTLAIKGNREFLDDIPKFFPTMTPVKPELAELYAFIGFD